MHDHDTFGLFDDSFLSGDAAGFDGVSGAVAPLASELDWASVLAPQDPAAELARSEAAYYDAIAAAHDSVAYVDDPEEKVVASTMAFAEAEIERAERTPRYPWD